MIPFVWNVQNKQIHRNKKLISDCQVLGGTAGKQELTVNGYKISFWDDKNVLELEDSDDDCATL